MYDASDIAKHLNIKDSNGKPLGRNRFLQYCRFNGMLMLDSNQPKQSMVTLGLMRYHMAKKRYKLHGMPLFSERCIAYIQRKIANGDFQLGFTKRLEKHKACVDLNEVC
jgi:hypothetical protein